MYGRSFPQFTHHWQVQNVLAITQISGNMYFLHIFIAQIHSFSVPVSNVQLYRGTNLKKTCGFWNQRSG